MVTDGEGQYKIVGLPSGTYVVTFTLPGFSTFRRDGLELSSGFTGTVNAELNLRRAPFALAADLSPADTVLGQVDQAWTQLMAGLNVERLVELPRKNPYVVFLHGTTWDTKHWPEAYWRELVAGVREIIITGEFQRSPSSIALICSAKCFEPMRHCARPPAITHSAAIPIVEPRPKSAIATPIVTTTTAARAPRSGAVRNPNGSSAPLGRASLRRTV